MTRLNYEPRKTVGFKELPWFFRIIIMMANDYDNDNGSDIGISFSIQHLDWQLYTITVGLTHKTYWCSSTYMTMTLTLLNLDCLAFEWLFFPWLAFLDGSKSRKLLIIWLSYGIISGNLANSGTNFLNPNSLSQKATKMSKKPSMTLLLWQRLISSVCVWYCGTFFKEVPIGQTNDPFHLWGSERFSCKVTWIVCQTYYSWEE